MGTVCCQHSGASMATGARRPPGKDWRVLLLPLGTAWGFLTPGTVLRAPDRFWRGPAPPPFSTPCPEGRCGAEWNPPAQPQSSLEHGQGCHSDPCHSSRSSLALNPSFPRFNSEPYHLPPGEIPAQSRGGGGKPWALRGTAPKPETGT